VALVLIAIVAALDVSETINLLLADGSAASFVFLLILAIVMADLIAKLISLASTTFPDLVPKLDERALKRATLINRLQPGQTLALLSGANTARVALFLVVFALLGASYASAPAPVQDRLFGDFGMLRAIEAFLREGIAGSIGYFLFFLGPDNLKQITERIAAEPLTASTTDGDIFLVGIRLYGLALVLAVLRTLVMPITYVRARLRARRLPSVVDVTGPMEA
jgi:hypothetical protein